MCTIKPALSSLSCNLFLYSHMIILPEKRVPVHRRYNSRVFICFYRDHDQQVIEELPIPPAFRTLNSSVIASGRQGYGSRNMVADDASKLIFTKGNGGNIHPYHSKGGKQISRLKIIQYWEGFYTSPGKRMLVLYRDFQIIFEEVCLFSQVYVRSR